MSFWKKSVTPAQWLSEVRFFEGFTDAELARVAELCTEATADKGAIIIDQGDAATECFVIVEGAASVYMSGEYVATLGAGTVVGEMALVDHKPRIATVQADSELHLLRFEASQFAKLLEEMPKASERVMTLLHERLT